MRGQSDKGKLERYSEVFGQWWELWR